MNLLLDTQVLLWTLSDAAMLSERARSAIADGSNTVFVSAATAWEIAIKKSIGKLKTPGNYLETLERYRFHQLDITSEHGLAVESLPPYHRDPFDRLLISQARLENLILVTRDTRMERYEVKLIRA